MLLDSIDLFLLALPLRSPREIAGRMCETLETVLVRLSGGGAAGWGEASPGNAPTASGEWAAGAFAVLRDWLGPAVVGSSIDSGEELAERLAAFQGNRFAKGALDMAWWDLKARQENRPLHELLDGKRQEIEVGPTIDRMDSIDDFLDAIRRAFSAGFSRVKLMFRPGWDVEMLRVVRQEFPAETFHIDCEGGLALRHMEMFYRLDDFQLAMIEQPLAADDLVGHAMVQESVRTPIGLDESITTPSQAEMALDLKSGRYVNLHPGRLGGITAAMTIHDDCQAAGVACWAGARPQSAIGTRFGLALAAKANCTYPADLFQAEQSLQEDVAPELGAVKQADGIARVELWKGPGIGIEPDVGVMLRRCVCKESLRP